MDSDQQHAVATALSSPSPIAAPALTGLKGKKATAAADELVAAGMLDAHQLTKTKRAYSASEQGARWLAQHAPEQHADALAALEVARTQARLDLLALVAQLGGTKAVPKKSRDGLTELESRGWIEAAKGKDRWQLTRAGETAHLATLPADQLHEMLERHLDALAQQCRETSQRAEATLTRGGHEQQATLIRDLYERTEAAVQAIRERVQELARATAFEQLPALHAELDRVTADARAQLERATAGQASDVQALREEVARLRGEQQHLRQMLDQVDRTKPGGDGRDGGHPERDMRGDLRAHLLALCREMTRKHSAAIPDVFARFAREHPSVDRQRFDQLLAALTDDIQLAGPGSAEDRGGIYLGTSYYYYVVQVR